jgi:hypothetical protein
MALEEKQQAIVYWWDKSHTGSVLEGSVDALAKDMTEEYVAVPVAPSRHVSLRFYAKRSARELALAASTLHLLQHYRRGDAMRASVDEVDALRAAQLCERDQMLIRLMRADRARLQASRAYPDTGAHSAGAYLRKRGCPCGGGPQTQHHLLWACALPGVVAARADAKAALKRQSSMLNDCESVTKEHIICRACCNALDRGDAPRGHSGLQGITPVQVNAADAAVECARHMLGIVRRPTGDSRLNEALRASKSVMLAVLAMQRAAESASIRITAQVVGQVMRHASMRHALSQIQLSAWLRPAKRALVPVAAPPQRQLRSQRRDAVPVLAVAVADMQVAAGYVRNVLSDGGGERPRRLRVLDKQLSHVLAAEAHIASACVRDADGDEAIEAIVEAVEASQRLLAAWRARVAAAPREMRRRQRARAAEAERLRVACAAVPAQDRTARVAAAAAAASRRADERRAVRVLALAQARRVVEAAAAAGVAPAKMRGGARRRTGSRAATATTARRVVVAWAAAPAEVCATVVTPSAPRGGGGGALAVVAGATPGAGECRGRVRPRGAGDDGGGARRVRARACVVATAVARVRVRERADDDDEADAAHARKRVCVVATAVVRERKRARGDGDDDASQGRSVRARRVTEAGGAPTPHQDGGGGILSGSGAV